VANKSQKKYSEKITNVAAVLAVVASLFAAMSWITSGKSGGTADDAKMMALSAMILRLESSTDASTAWVQVQTYITQAGMYFAYADRENNENVKGYLENLGYTSLAMSNFYIGVADNAENKAQSYYYTYETNLELAKKSDTASGNRSTGALIFNVAAVLAECAVLIKRKELLYVFLPIFAIGVYYLTISLF
jgi:hypothetical protein